MKLPRIYIFLLLSLYFSCDSKESDPEIDSPDDAIVDESGTNDTPQDGIPEDATPVISLENAFPKLGFSKPLDLQSPADGTNRIFVAEQGGTIQVFQNQISTSASETFLDIKSSLVSNGELGLLGLAFHPNYGENGLFYVFYTPSNDLAVISSFQVSGSNSNLADANSERILLRIPQPFTNHNGGQLAFGPDGFLYISSGDGGSGGDPQGNAQNLNNLLGKILRIDVDTIDNGLEYGIPSDNPFVNQGTARGEIYAYGLRNPWRMSFDTQTGYLWAGDVGQGNIEEIDIVISGGNYGWKFFEGTDCFSGDCNPSGLTPPIFEYDHNEGDKSITGGYVYRGVSLNSMQGRYVYGDFLSGRIWALNADSGASLNNGLLIESGLNLSSFGTDANNELYVCSFDGKIYKFVEN